MKYHLILALISVCLILTPLTADSQENQIYIDQVDFSSDDAGGIHTNVPVTFKFGLENNSGQTVFMLANGFRLYSPDGAEWELKATLWNPKLNWVDIFGGLFPMVYPYNGATEDTVGFSVFLEKSSRVAGIPSGFNDIAWYLSIEADIDQIGKTICIDSSSFPPFGSWNWTVDGLPGALTPDWSGSQCFTFTSPGPLCGDINSDGGHNISDLTYMVDYMFRGGPPPASIWTADWNGDCSVDIGDITGIVIYLFQGSFPPSCCDYSF